MEANTGSGGVPTELKYQLRDRSGENWSESRAAQALKRMQENPRIKYVVIIAPANACPACQGLVGTYPKDEVPRLPIEYCSNPNGCTAYYLPYLQDIYP